MVIEVIKRCGDVSTTIRFEEPQRWTLTATLEIIEKVCKEAGEK